MIDILALLADNGISMAPRRDVSGDLIIELSKKHYTVGRVVTPNEVEMLRQPGLLDAMLRREIDELKAAAGKD